MLRGLSLFSGYGGIDLALMPWVRTICYVEIEEYAQRIIAERMADGSLDRAPILADVKNVEGEIGDCDIIFGGFPCQDISVAGNGKGLEGERSGLFFEIARLASEIRPRFIFLENVPAISIRGLDRVLLELTSLGYDCRWTIVSAGEVGAKHRRERWFLLAYTSGEQLRISEPRQWNEKIYASTALENGSLADSNGERLERLRSQIKHESTEPFTTDLLEGNTWDEYAGFLHRVDHGTPFRVDRIKAVGNGVVPLQVQSAFLRLLNLGEK